MKVELYAQHILEEMADVRCRRCGHHFVREATVIRRVEGTKKAEICAQHAKDGMVGVGNRSRGGRGCSTHPFTVRRARNQDGTKKRGYCNQHAKPGMVSEFGFPERFRDWRLKQRKAQKSVGASRPS